MNIFEGDPRLVLTPDGSDLDYRGGQPVMDQGLENQALISLFTREGWAGNIFLPESNGVGSDFEATCLGTITLSKLANIENSAERALTSNAFPDVTVTVTNPKADHLRVEALLGAGLTLSLTREGTLWRNQAENPAYRRIDLQHTPPSAPANAVYATQDGRIYTAEDGRLFAPSSLG
jgi:hypothetical protein